MSRLVVGERYPTNTQEHSEEDKNLRDSEQADPGPLLSLPQELILYILTFLSLCELLGMQEVNKQLQKLAQDKCFFDTIESQILIVLIKGDNKKRKNTSLFYKKYKEYKNDSKQQDSYENTLAHWAVIFNQANVLQMTLKKQPDLLDRQNKRGKSALMLAADYGNVGCVQYLLEKRANLDLQDFDANDSLSILRAEGDNGTRLGDTALTLAQKKNHNECICLLRIFEFLKSEEKSCGASLFQAASTLKEAREAAPMFFDDYITKTISSDDRLSWMTEKQKERLLSDPAVDDIKSEKGDEAGLQA